MTEPQRAQYRGGIILNPDFDHNIKDWTVFGNGTIEEQISNDGNRFIIASNRTQPLDGFSQKVQLNKGIMYTFSGKLCFSIVDGFDVCYHVVNLIIYFLKHFPNSAWFQLREGSDTVSVVFKTNVSELVRGGNVIAKHGCWSLLKGGIVADFSIPAEIIFEVESSRVFRSIVQYFIIYMFIQNLFRIIHAWKMSKMQNQS